MTGAKKGAEEGNPPGPAGQLFELSTDAVPVAERFAFWRETVLNRTEPDLPADPDGAFHGRLRCYAGSTAQIRDGRSAPIILRRTPQRCRRDSGDEFLLSMYSELDAGQLRHPGAPDLAVRPRQIVMVDMAQPFQVRLGAYRELNFRLPRAAVAVAIGGDPGRLGGRTLPVNSLSGLLFEQVRMLADALPGLNAAGREAALDATTALALATLRIEFQQGRVEQEELSDGLWAAAERYIGFNFGRHDLSPDLLAQALRCSRSHLYRMFERRGLTVMAYVFSVRLARARYLLASPGCRMPIGEVALLCGFDDASSFARSFKRQYGLSPSDFRREAQGRQAQGRETPGREAETARED